MFARGDAEPCVSPSRFGLTPWLGRTREIRVQELPTCNSTFGLRRMADPAGNGKNGDVRVVGQFETHRIKS